MDMDETTFQNRLHLYGITPLTSLSKEFVSCINIIVNAKSDFEETAYQNMYDFYSKRKTYIDAELTVRNRQYSYIQSMADFINGEMNMVKTSLNLQTYLGSDLWKIFCSYRREDKYQNDNYISDGLNNAEVLARAQHLVQPRAEGLVRDGQADAARLGQEGVEGFCGQGGGRVSALHEDVVEA